MPGTRWSEWPAPFASRVTTQTPHLPQPRRQRTNFEQHLGGRAISGRFVVARPCKVADLASDSRLESSPKSSRRTPLLVVQRLPRPAPVSSPALRPAPALD